jgi:hypothetical protein
VDVAARTRKIDANVLRADADGAGVVVRYAPVRGTLPEIVDRITLGAPDDVAAVNGVGRLLRLLRAARIKAPRDPYTLGDDPEATAELLRHCQGTRVTLHVAQRFERELVIWTEDGVSRIDRVLDVTEEPDGLSVRRRGGDSLLRIARHSLIRFTVNTREFSEVVSVEIPTKASLR